MSEIIVSIDVETNGPIPGQNSMWALGAVAFNGSFENEIDSFLATFEDLPGSQPDPDTMAWWGTQDPAIVKRLRSNLETPEAGTKRFAGWLSSLPGKPTAMAYPAGFDFTWTYWYLMKFNKFSPVGFQCIDLKTMMADYTGLEFRKVSKGTLKRMHPEWWREDLEHTHLPDDDAREQAYTYFKVKEFLERRR